MPSAWHKHSIYVLRELQRLVFRSGVAPAWPSVTTPCRYVVSPHHHEEPIFSPVYRLSVTQETQSPQDTPLELDLHSPAAHHESHRM